MLVVLCRPLGAVGWQHSPCLPSPPPRPLCSWADDASPTFDEASPAGSDYLAEVCVEWEAAARTARDVRLVLLRTGIVLDVGGGALAKMLPAFAFFAGGPIGSGQQWFSWVHRQDVVGLILAAINDARYEGPLNAVAPGPVRMAEACEAIGRAMSRPSWMPVPGFVVSALLGEGARVVLEGQRVLPTKAQALGFPFRFRSIDEAMGAIAGPK